jgi:hypothetical protein
MTLAGPAAYAAGFFAADFLGLMPPVFLFAAMGFAGPFFFGALFFMAAHGTARFGGRSTGERVDGATASPGAFLLAPGRFLA